MEFYEREHFISRIRSGYVRIKVNGKVIRVYGPPSDIEYEAASLHREVYEDRLIEGLLIDDDIYDILIDHGLWTELDQHHLDNVLPDHVEKLKVELFNSLLKTKTQLQVRKYLAVAKEELERLHKIRHMYDYVTCMGLAHFARSQFIVKSCSFYDDGEPVDWDEMDINSVMTAWQRESMDSSIIRELARTPPWNSEWQSLKVNNRIFENDNLTVEQKSLINLSCMYDKIYESAECPTEEVIADDDMLDGWLIAQKSKMDKEKRNRETESQIAVSDRINNAEEVFIPVESIEDAKRINELNTAQSSGIKDQRLKMVEKHGKVKHQHMPDMKQKLAMQATKAYRDTMKGG